MNTYAEQKKCVWDKRYADEDYKDWLYHNKIDEEAEMGITAKEGKSGDFKLIPEGMHQAVAYMVFDLGTQFNERWNNSSRKVLIGWEIPDERIEVEGVSRPMVVSKRYTLSLHEKAILRNDLESWRSKKFTSDELKGFDISKLLGVNCNLQILHNEQDGKTYTNVQTVTPLMKTQEKIEPENEFVYFSFEDDDEFPDNVPEWIVNVAKKSQEWQDIQGGNQAIENEMEPPPIEDSEIPF